MESFSTRLRRAMNAADLSQKALAEKSGCSRAAISQYLSGKHIPNEQVTGTLAAALGVEPGILLGTAPEPDTPPPPTVTRIGTRRAAQCMQKSEQFVRVGLQRGILPFGNAVPGTGKCYNYYISPVRFRDYVGAARFDEFFGQ